MVSFVFQEVYGSSNLDKNEKENEIRRIKDELQLRLRQDEEKLKKRFNHDQFIARLQMKRQKALLLHILEQKLFEEVRSIPSVTREREKQSSLLSFLIIRNVRRVWIRSCNGITC